MRRRLLILLAAGLVLAGPFLVGYRLSHGSRATAPVGVPLVDEVRNALSSRYYRPVPDRVLKLGSVAEIISALGDPYTTYLAPVDYQLLRRDTASSYSGIGVSVLPSPRGFVVVSLRPGPAQRAGVRVGDTIVRIDGKPTGNLGMRYALSRIVGPRGSFVSLQLARGHGTLRLRIRREVISAPSVQSQLLTYAGRRWGHVRLERFRTGAAVVLGRELRRLERQGVDGFVLDLRQNPGGLLVQAVGVASLFLDRGVVVSLAGRHEPHEVFRAVGGVATRLPVVVLVDRFTASSAEIVAAALRDHERAVVVGERTFGKAVVQSIDPLDNGAALEMTVARYYTPSGADISSVGIVPEIPARDDRRTPEDEALATALKVLARPAS